MAELEVGVGYAGIEGKRLAVRVFGLEDIAGFLQSMPVLDPYRGIVGVATERLMVIAPRERPVSPISRPICQRDRRLPPFPNPPHERASPPLNFVILDKSLYECEIYASPVCRNEC